MFIPCWIFQQKNINIVSICRKQYQQKHEKFARYPNNHDWKYRVKLYVKCLQFYPCHHNWAKSGEILPSGFSYQCNRSACASFCSVFKKPSLIPWNSLEMPWVIEASWGPCFDNFAKFLKVINVYASCLC